VNDLWITTKPCIIIEEKTSFKTFVFVSANTLYGPMHTKSGVQEYIHALEEIKKQGGRIAFGGKVLSLCCEYCTQTFEVRSVAEIY